jgi:hypothetical protein
MSDDESDDAPNDGSSELLFQDCVQRGTDIVNSFFLLYVPQSDTTAATLEKLKSDSMDVRKQVLLVSRKYIGTNAFVAQLPGMMDGILAHLSLKSDSESIRETLREEVSWRACVVLTDSSKLLSGNGKANSGAFRVVWKLQNVLTAFTNSMTHTIPELEYLSANHADKTMTPQDVLKVTMPNSRSPVPAMLWMKGDHYDQFENRYAGDWWYLQAIELNPPKLGDGSERYQFHNCTLDAWPGVIDIFMTALQKVSIDAFARIKSGYDPGVPYTNDTCNDMPVAARIPNITQTSKPRRHTFLPHTFLTICSLRFG